MSNTCQNLQAMLDSVDDGFVSRMTNDTTTEQPVEYWSRKKFVEADAPEI